jgi:hypothetical protein
MLRVDAVRCTELGVRSACSKVVLVDLVATLSYANFTFFSILCRADVAQIAQAMLHASLNR